MTRLIDWLYASEPGAVYSCLGLFLSGALILMWGLLKLTTPKEA